MLEIFLSKEQFKKPINLNKAINIKEFINKSIITLAIFNVKQNQQMKKL